MAEKNLLNTTIIQQIEAYISEEKLKTDYNLAKYVRDNNGWIPVELLSRLNKFSIYNHNAILYALLSKQSNIIELSSFEPKCIRRRCQPLTEVNSEKRRTVVINGLPSNVKYEELTEFFNRFYPINEIKIVSPLNNSNRNIHAIFEKSQDASAFVQQSKLTSIIYINDELLQLCHGYTLICKMLHDYDDKGESKLNDQHTLMKGKSFSTRLNNHPSRVSFNTNVSLGNKNPVHHKSTSISSQTKSCLKSNTCVTEQILFCQNATNNKLIKSMGYENEKIIYNKFSYDIYMPDHLLKQIHECIIISVLNPHCFTIQLKQDAIEFDKFQREINVFYNCITDKQFFLTSEQIRINLCVICSDSKSLIDNEKIWNRSQILDFDPSDNTVNLFYVDLGTWDEYVPIDRLRHLTERFHNHLVFSLTCRLAHILPLNNTNDYLTWTDDATNQFLAVIEQVRPEMELLSFSSNGCFEANLFVTNSGHDVYVNEYMVHIKQAKAVVNTTNMDDDGQHSIRSDEHDINGTGSPIHPVIALYNKLGEALQQSLAGSSTASISSSSRSSPSILPRSFVKLIHVNIQTNNANQQQILPIVFVRYQKSILIPDFTICTLLKTINSTIDSNTIEQYALAIRYPYVHVTLESNFDIFTQISPLIDTRYSTSIALYTLDFVGYILKHYNFRVINVFLALENAQQVEIHETDLASWFTLDNELITSSTPVSDSSTKLNQSNGTPPIIQQSPMTIRLPFSNRLINLT